MQVEKTHEPVFLKNPADRGLVVFIHGFLGSPRQFDELSDVAQQDGYSTAELLLPGHGGTAKEFAAGTFERWQAYVDEEVARFSRDYDNILLAGHSMGGLLAINAAVSCPGHVRGILTIACPFKLTFFSTYAIKIRLKQFFSKKGDPIKAAYISNCSVKQSPSLLWRVFKPKAELDKLIASALDKLPDVDVPVIAVYSSSDELTSIESLGILYSGLTGASFEQVLLSDSLHAYYTEDESEMIKQALRKLMARGIMRLEQA